MCIRIDGINLQAQMALQPRRPASISFPPRQPQISYLSVGFIFIQVLTLYPSFSQQQEVITLLRMIITMVTTMRLHSF